jgi:hypothetical protein
MHRQPVSFAASLAILLIIPVVAAASTVIAPRTAPLANWTVMIYINGRGGLDCAVFDTLREITSVRSNPQVQIVVEIGRSPKEAQCPDKAIPRWEGIRRFSVRHAMTIGPRIGAAPPPKISDMSSPDTLKDFLSWAKDKFPSKKSMLIIWGHGIGLPLLDLETIKAQSVSAAGPCSNSDEPSGTTKGVFIGDGSEGTLFNRDIANVLRDVEDAGKKLSIIGFDACLMGNIETAYALRNVADLMVASEANVPACSWDYTYALSKLARANGGTDPKTLSKLFVEGYARKYQGTPRTLSAVDLGVMDSLAREISRLAEGLRGNLGAEKPGIVDVRGTAEAFGFLDNLIDFSDFLQVFQKQRGIDQSTLIRARKVLSRIGSAVIAEFGGDNSSFSGLTIYFPQNTQAYQGDSLDRDAYDLASCEAEDRDLKHTVDFVCDTAWPKFVHSFLGVPDIQIASQAPGK